MSKDIRSFFSVLSKKNSAAPEPKKKKVYVIDSDDDDVIESTPERNKTSKTKQKSSDVSSSHDVSLKIDKNPKPAGKQEDVNLKPVIIDNVFTSNPIKQSKVVSIPKIESKNESQKSAKSKKKKTEKGVHGDVAFEETLMQLDDDDLIMENLDVLDKTFEEALSSCKTLVQEDISKNKKDEHNESSKTKGCKTSSESTKMKNGSSKDISASKSNEINAGSSKENSPNKPKDIELNKSKEKGSKRQRNPSEGSTPKKPKLEHTDSGIDPDQEVFEKKRYSAMLYQKYKNRAGPKMHGQKEVPKGNPDCLKNLTFLRTGVLDSLEGEEFANVVAEHGGKVVKSVSKKVNYVVVGEDPGPAKLEKSRGYGIQEINEDEFFDLILLKSGKKRKYAQQSSDSQESGICIDESPDEKRPKIERDQKEERESKNKDRKKKKRSPADKKKHGSPKELEKTKNKPSVQSDSNSSHKKENIDEKLPKLESKKCKEEKISKLETNTKLHKKYLDKDDAEKKLKVTSENLKPEELPLKSETLESGTSKLDSSSLAWTEKYKPTNVKAIIGQQGDSSNLAKLTKWLKYWYRNQLPEVRKKIPKPSPWAKNDDGAYYKAALLSGPPGVGKTTTATLVSQELGFDIVEFNASDTRSKKLLQAEVSQILQTTTIAGFAAGKQKTDRKRVLLMDEVDGMAGNEDRGGIQELISLIKNTNVPIICMCNDRNHQKMRSLVNYCFDLRFSRPRLEQIRGAMMSICFKEGLKLPVNVVSEIVAGTGCDIRQTLNNLTMYAALNQNNSLEDVQIKSKESKKDTIMGPWEVVRCVFTESEQKKMSLPDKSRLFFYDYSLGPLFVQENYLGVTPNCPKKDILKQVAKAADSISQGDLIDAKIRSSNNWALLESQAMFSSVLPGHYMSGNVTSRINFPGWLGKNSSANKHKRLLSELHAHARMSISGSAMAMKLDYLVPLRDAIINPLIKDGFDGVFQSVQIMRNYNLLREDLNNLIELCHWKDSVNPFNRVDAKIKAAFTRAYNKEAPKTPFSLGAGFSKKKVSHADDGLDEDEEMSESDDEKKEDVNADSLIKVKSRKKTEAASTSKKRGTSKTQSKEKGKSKK